MDTDDILGDDVSFQKVLEPINSILDELEKELEPFPDYAEFKSDDEAFMRAHRVYEDSLRIRQLHELRKRVLILCYEDEDFTTGLFYYLHIVIVS